MPPICANTAKEQKTESLRIAEELARCFRQTLHSIGGFESRPHIAIGCSGGADSLALTFLAQDWVQAQNGRATALIIDHGLRPESANQAQKTLETLHERGISALCLSPDGAALAETVRNVQDYARRLRFRAFAQWCCAQGVAHLLLGHHLEDQAETVILRRMRASTVYGLAAMQPVSWRDFGRVIRPLLETHSETLKTYLRARNIGWIEDASNQSARFLRVRVRKTLLDNRAESHGENSKSLAVEARLHGQQRRQILTKARKIIARRIEIAPLCGYLWLDGAGWQEEEQDPRQRALAWMLVFVSGRHYEPRRRQIVRADAALSSLALPNERGALDFCTAGCRLKAGLRKNGSCEDDLRRDALHTVLICRHQPRPLPILQRKGKWDGRYDYEFSREFPYGLPCATGAQPNEPLILMGVGKKGWQQLQERSQWSSQTRRELADLPYPVRLSLPSLWRGECLIALPLQSAVPLLYDSGSRMAACPRMRFSPSRRMLASD